MKVFTPAMFAPEPRDSARRPQDIPDKRIAVRIAVVAESGCWIWMGSLNNNGYGHFVRHGHKRQKKIYVHRYIYMVFKGDIPLGYEVHHTCWNRACCAPEHLVAVTRKENLNA